MDFEKALLAYKQFSKEPLILSSPEKKKLFQQEFDKLGGSRAAENAARFFRGDKPLDIKS